jgi:hypothetical protein
MIIAYYPEAGGNRYQQMIQNIKWQKSNTTYDAVNPEHDTWNKFNPS